MENLTEEQAFCLEKLLIAFYGRKDNGTGILRNLTDGGDGTSGRVVSDQERERSRAVGLACVENNVGIHAFSEEVKSDWRKKGSQVSALVNSRSFTVKTLQGEVVTGVNITAFTKQHDIRPNNFISMLNGKQRQAYGYVLPETPVQWFVVTNEHGESFTLCEYDNHTEFCAQHKLDLTSFGRMLQGRYKRHKKWKLSSTYFV